MNRLISLCVCALALGLGACTKYDHFEVNDVEAPHGGYASTSEITIPLGAMVKAQVQAVTAGGLVMPGYVRTADRSVVEIRMIAGETQRFAFMGTAPGRTSLEFYANGEVQFTVMATVFEP